MTRRDFMNISAAGAAGAAVGQTLGCASVNSPRKAAPGTETLRSLGAKRDLLVGSACACWMLNGNPTYRDILAREFNCIVAENAMKMDAVQPARGKFNFDGADIMMKFAAKHDMKVRAVPLVWHDGLPGWANDKTFSRDEALEILREHIFTVMKRYKGKIFAWDVLNEAIGDRGPGLQDKGPWLRSIGPDYVEKIYHWAHKIDPKAQLFYNDFYINRMSQKAQWCYDWIKEELARGVPIHGIGLQYHIQVTNYPARKEAIDNMKRFIDLGLIVHITELDVWLPKNYTEEDLKKQAEVYREVFEIALSLPECPAVVCWGFSDIHSWVPYTSGGSFCDALMFDRDFKPKPAYEAIRSALREG